MTDATHVSCSLLHLSPAPSAADGAALKGSPCKLEIPKGFTMDEFLTMAEGIITSPLEHEVQNQLRKISPDSSPSKAVAKEAQEEAARLLPNEDPRMLMKLGKFLGKQVST